jgi:hypothetical protein
LQRLYREKELQQLANCELGQAPEKKFFAFKSLFEKIKKILSKNLLFNFVWAHLPPPPEPLPVVVVQSMMVGRIVFQIAARMVHSFTGITPIVVSLLPPFIPRPADKTLLTYLIL